MSNIKFCFATPGFFPVDDDIDIGDLDIQGVNILMDTDFLSEICKNIQEEKLGNMPLPKNCLATGFSSSMVESYKFQNIGMSSMWIETFLNTIKLYEPGDELKNFAADREYPEEDYDKKVKICDFTVGIFKSSFNGRLYCDFSLKIENDNILSLYMSEDELKDLLSIVKYLDCEKKMFLGETDSLEGFNENYYGKCSLENVVWEKVQNKELPDLFVRLGVETDEKTLKNINEKILQALKAQKSAETFQPVSLSLAESDCFRMFFIKSANLCVSEDTERTIAIDTMNITGEGLTATFTHTWQDISSQAEITIPLKEFFAMRYKLYLHNSYILQADEELSPSA